MWNKDHQNRVRVLRVSKYSKYFVWLKKKTKQI